MEESDHFDDNTYTNTNAYPNYSASSGFSGIAGGLKNIARGLAGTVSGITEIGSGARSVGRSGLDAAANFVGTKNSTFEDLTGCFFGPTVNVSFSDIHHLYGEALRAGVMVSEINRCGVMPSRLRVKITLIFRGIYLVKPIINYDVIQRGYLFFERKGITYIMEAALHRTETSKELYLIPDRIFFNYNFPTLSLSQTNDSTPQDTLYALYSGSLSYDWLLSLGPAREFAVRLTANGTLRKFYVNFDGSEFKVSDSTSGLEVRITRGHTYVLLESSGLGSGSVGSGSVGRRSGFGNKRSTRNKRSRKGTKGRKGRRSGKGTKGRKHKGTK